MGSRERYRERLAVGSCSKCRDGTRSGSRGVAEETGLVVPLGKLVLEESCRRVKAWQEAGLPDGSSLTLSLNLGARQFQQSDLVEDVRETLTRTGLAPSCLKLEITESDAMEDVESTLETLRKLKALGIRISIDDLGTGYSSLVYLKRFPVDTLKIDRSFVDRLGEDPESAAIVATTISLARVALHQKSGSDTRGGS